MHCQAIVTVNVHAVLKPTDIRRDDGKRPDGMTLISWRNGKSLVWDAACVDTVALSHIESIFSTAGSAAAVAEILKRRHSSSSVFMPFGMETLDPWAPDAKLLFKEMLHLMTQELALISARE